jgi:cobalamin-dependent methionine synthase I
MLIVGEEINTSRPAVTEAVGKRDKGFITEIARKQVEAGAHYLDVNASTFLHEEPECLRWLVETIQSEIRVPLCLASNNPKAVSEALMRHEGQPMVNGVSLDPDHFAALAPVVGTKSCRVVAQCSSGKTPPETFEQKVQIGSELIEKLTAKGIALDRIYLDPCIQPMGVNSGMAITALEAMRELSNRYLGIHTICGLSGVSFGLPKRRLINSTFLAIAMAYGLTAAVLNPLDQQLMATVLAAEMILGRDDGCERYISAYQKGKV